MEQTWKSQFATCEDTSINTIVSAIAEAEDIDVTELSTPLNEIVDTDALVQLLADADKTTRVTFQYQQWLVMVQGDGVVEVTNPSGEE